MNDEISSLLSKFDEKQADVLQSILLKMATAKQERITGVVNIEMHVSQGAFGDVYCSERIKIRSSRKRKVRSSGLK